MRLIDADALIEQMKGMNMLFSPKIVIDNMPTAYDIDKVVEELKEWSANVTILELHNNELGEYEEECKRDVICTLNAIDIVEQGLKEKKDD